MERTYQDSPLLLSQNDGEPTISWREWVDSHSIAEARLRSMQTGCGFADTSAQRVSCRWWAENAPCHL